MKFFQIFTEDLQEVESLPRQKVLDHLRKNAYGLVVPYLVCHICFYDVITCRAPSGTCGPPLGRPNPNIS